MNDYPLCVKIVAYAVIIPVYLMLPLYGLCLVSGALADKRGQRRHHRLVRRMLS